MSNHRPFLCIPALLLLSVSSTHAQEERPANPAGAPPNLLLLVHQEIQFGKTAQRQKLEGDMVRACERLNVPNSWIHLQSLTGPPKALFFDPFDSFEHVGNAYADWGRIYAAHPELGRIQEGMEATLSSERTIIAVRRDDLGYLPLTTDFSQARFLRVLEVRLHPGHENEFVEAFKILGEAYEKIRATTPWVVYQVDVGMPSPAFLVFLPMRALQQNDDLLAWRKTLREAEGEERAREMEQIARNAYAGMESNLYAIRPEMSHVSKEFAQGDLEFWSSKKPSAPRLPPRKDPKP